MREVLLNYYDKEYIEINAKNFSVEIETCIGSCISFQAYIDCRKILSSYNYTVQCGIQFKDYDSSYAKVRKHDKDGYVEIYGDEEECEKLKKIVSNFSSSVRTKYYAA